MSLDDYLDGTYVAPKPTIGGTRDEVIQFLYPGRWHTCIGLTTAAKTWWALWHARRQRQNRLLGRRSYGLPQRDHRQVPHVQLARHQATGTQHQVLQDRPTSCTAETGQPWPARVARSRRQRQASRMAGGR